MNQTESNIGIGCYLQNEYEEILSISEDRENMELTWQGWKQKKEAMKQKLKSTGIEVIDVLVKPIELMDYCRSRGLKIDGKSRSQFVQYKVTYIK